MVRAALALLLLLAGGGPSRAAHADLVTLFADWRRAQADPTTDGVPDYRAAALAGQAAELRRLRARLDALSLSGWTVAQKIDWNLVRAEMDGLDFSLRVARPWARDPAWYVSVWTEQSDTPDHEGPVHAHPVELWRYTFPLSAPEAERLAADLAHVPPLLAQARGNLTGDAADLWRAGLEPLAEQEAALAGLVPRVAGTVAAPAVESARAATADFRAWVAARAPAKRGPSGVGRANYDWYLKHVLLSPLDWAAEETLLKRELARAHAALRLEEAANAGLPPLAPAAGPAAYDAQANAAADRYIAFLRDRRILTVRDYMRAALMIRVGSYVAPERQDFFQMALAREPTALFAHFYHWWDLADMAANPHPSPIRRGPLRYNIWAMRAEGQATAMEEAMLHAGLFQGRGREVVWIMAAQRAARGLASLYAQANRIDLAAAMRMQVARTPNGWMRPGPRLLGFEQSLYLRQPGYGPSYITGKAAIDALMAELAERDGAAFRMAGFYDGLNGFGMIPPALIRWQWLGATDEVDAIGVRR